MSNYPSSLPLCVRLPWLLSAVLVSGTPGADVAQTLRFSVFHACPPTPRAFRAHFAQNRALPRVWRTRGLLTSVFVERIGFRIPLTSKVSCFVMLSCVYVSKTTVNVDSMSKLCAQTCLFGTLAWVLYYFQEALQNSTET